MSSQPQPSASAAGLVFLPSWAVGAVAVMTSSLSLVSTRVPKKTPPNPVTSHRPADPSGEGGEPAAGTGTGEGSTVNVAPVYVGDCGAVEIENANI